MNERFSNRDYNQLGEDAANLFISRKEQTLMDAVIKVACDNNLTTNGVERLAEKANQYTQLSIFKGASDKKMEFDVVDPTVAARQYTAYNTQSNINKQASFIVDRGLSTSIPNFVLKDKLQKIANSNEQCNITKEASESEEQVYRQLKAERNQLKAKVDSISLEKMASYCQMEKIVDDIIFEYGHVNADPFIKVAYDAYNVYGDEIYPFIKHISLSIKKPIDKNTFIKEASEQSHIIDDTTSTMSKIASYIDLQRTFFKSSANIDKHNKRILELNESMNKLCHGGMCVI